MILQKSSPILLLLCLGFSVFVQADNPLLMVHYMPWYQTPAVSGYWGWHWTMNHFDPNERDGTGRREIASQYYPVTGPYDSSDDVILEYQVLLMKVSGIDGVIVDWYGTEDFRDYRVLHEAAQKVKSYTDLARLRFSICYEDQTIKHMVDENHISESQAIAQGKQDMTFMEEEWFYSGEYLILDDRPVLLNFGPQYFYSGADWEALFSDMNNQPLFFTLNNRLSSVAAGAFPWPPVSSSANDTLSQNALYGYLSNFYQKSESWDYLVAGAFPAFHDIYEKAGLGYGYGIIDPLNGATFDSTLQTALDHNPDVIQIITWNDYGEGTIIEPTLEFGLQYLEMIQDVKRNAVDGDWIYTTEDLNLPLQFLNLRRHYADDDYIMELLYEVFDMIVYEEMEPARTIIDSLTVLAHVDKEPEAQPADFRLFQNYPNPFNPETRITFHTSEESHVRLSVYNIAGQRIATLVNSRLPKGRHDIRFSGNNLPAGIYFYRLKTANHTATNKMILLP